MGTLKQQPSDSRNRTGVSEERLRRLMSDVISLREKVVQAELLAQRYGRLGEDDEGNQINKGDRLSA
jgi:hypothetical protein